VQARVVDENSSTVRLEQAIHSCIHKNSFTALEHALTFCDDYLGQDICGKDDKDTKAICLFNTITLLLLSLCSLHYQLSLP